MSHPRPGAAARYTCPRWIPLIAGIAAGWLVLAVVAALLLGRAVHLADRRRPRAGRPRRSAAAALDRVVEIATGAIPVIRPRVLQAVTGAIPIIRPRVD